MKTTLSRVQALESDLTPKQIVMGILEKMQECGTLDAYIAWSYTDKALKRTDEIRENMYAAAKRRTNSKDSHEHNKACRKAHQEFQFLYELALAPCINQDQNLYRYLFMTSTVVHLMGSFWRTLQKDKLETLQKEAQQAKAMLFALLLELHADQMVSEKLSSKYFHGKPLLLPAQGKFLERVTANAIQLTEHLNEAGGLLQALEPERIEGDGFSIDIEALQAMAERRASELVKQIELQVRITIYSNEGRHDQAIRLFQRVIFPGE